LLYSGKENILIIIHSEFAEIENTKETMLHKIRVSFSYNCKKL